MFLAPPKRVAMFSSQISTHISNLSSTWPMLGSRSLHRSLCVVVALLIVLSAYASTHWQDIKTKHSDLLHHNLPSFHFGGGGGGGAPPDPLKLPGWVEDTKWVNSNPDVQLHHWLERMSEGKPDGEDLDWARNKTILMLGDSVVRDMIWRLCMNHVKKDRKLVRLDDKVNNEKTQGWECVVPQTQTRLINGFIYGELRSAPLCGLR